MNRKQIKEWSKNKAKGNGFNVWKPIFVMLLIIFVTGNIIDVFEGTAFENIIGLVIELALLPLSVGVVYYMINLVKDKEFNLKDMIEPYKDFIRVVLTMTLSILLVLVGLLIFVIPGIIVALGITLVPYLLATRKDLKPIEVIQLSMKMMKGHKWEYFVFQLSFLGWMILSTLTFGILYIWVLPYISIANTKYILTIMDEDSIIVA